jgi:hypothetical protein
MQVALHELVLQIEKRSLADSSFATEVTEGLQDHWENDELTDVTLVFGKEEASIKCHRAVLAASSQYFRTMFTTNMRERKSAEVEILGVDAETGRSIIKFFYYGKVHIDVDNALQLLLSTNMWMIPKLKKQVEEFICRNVKSFDVVQLLTFARLCELSGLLEAARKHLILNPVDMASEYVVHLNVDDMETILLSWYETAEEAFQFLQRWVHYKESTREEMFLVLLRCIPLENCSKEFILDSHDGEAPG